MDRGICVPDLSHFMVGWHLGWAAPPASTPQQSADEQSLVRDMVADVTLCQLEL
jgi:hypothetical protein